MRHARFVLLSFFFTVTHAEVTSVLGHAGSASAVLTTNAVPAKSKEGPPDPDGSALAFTTFMAFAGGIMTASGANALAWFSHQTRTGLRVFSAKAATLFYLACLALNILGIGMFAISTILGGAVATVMPVQTGANLLTNMILQVSLKIKTFNKSMRTGTLLLVCAVAQLSQIGPEEPESPDVGRLLDQPVAIIWILTMVTGALGGIAASRTFKDLPSDSTLKLLSLTSVVTFTTVLGASVGKCFGLLSGLPLFATMLSYLCIGVVCLVYTMIATANCDVSIFIPLQLSSQLVLNMITGFFVWGDSHFVQKPVAYILVYVICLQAVYLISTEIDFVGEWALAYQIRKTMLSEQVASSALGTAMLNLATAWEQPNAGETWPTKPCLDALREAVELGLEKEAISKEELVDLSMLLLEDKGSAGGRPVLVTWMESLKHFTMYSKRDPAFGRRFREALSTEEKESLDIVLENQKQKQQATPSVASFHDLNNVPASSMTQSHRIPESELRSVTHLLV